MRDISDILDINKRRVEMIIKKYIKTGKIRDGTSSLPVPAKLTEAQAEIMRHWAGLDASISGAELVRRVHEEFGVVLTASACYRYIGGFIFSLKRMPPLGPVTVNDARTIDLRQDFANIFVDLLASYQETEIVFVGQMRFKLSIRDRESRGKVRMRNMSVAVAMTRLDVVAYCGQNPPIAREQYQDFVLSLIDEQREAGLDSGIIVMDENECKDDCDTMNQLIASKNFTNIFLPPFSPFLNPLETLFGEWREMLLRESPQNETELVQLIEEGRKLITHADLERYFESLHGYVMQCANGSPVEPNDLYSIYADALRDDDNDVEDDKTVITSTVIVKE